MRKTPNNLIHIGSPINFDEELFLKQLEKLMLASYDNESNIIEMVEDVVSTYHHVVNKPMEKSMGEVAFDNKVSGGKYMAVGGQHPTGA